VVFELKRPSMSVQNLFLPGEPPKSHCRLFFSITSCRKRHKDVLPVPFFAYFTPSGLLFPPESEIRAGKLLVDPGHLQEELVGGRPHHRYIKAYRRRPRVDRGLQKNTRIADDHAKKLCEARVSLK
jgi:hypothetical protein